MEAARDQSAKGRRKQLATNTTMNKTKIIELLRELLKELEAPEREIDILWQQMSKKDKEVAIKLALSSKVITIEVDSEEMAVQFQRLFVQLTNFERFNFCQSIKEFDRHEIRLDGDGVLHQVIIFKDLGAAIARYPDTKHPYILKLLGREDEIEH